MDRMYCTLVLLGILVTLSLPGGSNAAPTSSADENSAGKWASGCGYCSPTENSIMSQAPGTNCTKYHWIVNDDQIFTMPCSPGTLFDPVACTCNFPWLVNCNCDSNVLPN